MVAWREFEQAAPALAGTVRDLFQAHRHKTLATLRRDGSPRLSGTEVEFRDGQVWLGSMAGAMKARDLLRDPRLALHSATVAAGEDDPAAWPGDAKLAGVAVAATAEERAQAALPAGEDDSHLFRVDVTEVVWTHIDPTGRLLVVEAWHPGRGVRVFRRS